MLKHAKEKITLLTLLHSKWKILLGLIISIALIISMCIISPHFYTAPIKHIASPPPPYSATTIKRNEPSRDYYRDNFTNTPPYVVVNINGNPHIIWGKHFTTVKTVLDSGDIVLMPHDTIQPDLNERIQPHTIITINRAEPQVKIDDTPIAFNIVEKQTTSLPQGTQQIQTQGVNGVMETTNLVKKAGNKIISSTLFGSHVKIAPTEQVVLIGTQPTSNIQTNLTTITVPMGDMQKWAHDYLLSHGYTEADFSATVYIISHESGWRVDAKNTSGAYGLPQALPGNKMISAGADWATNYQTQLKWFWIYCAKSYGSIQGAYQHWLTHHNY